MMVMLNHATNAFAIRMLISGQYVNGTAWVTDFWIMTSFITDEVEADTKLSAVAGFRATPQQLTLNSHSTVALLRGMRRIG